MSDEVRVHVVLSISMSDNAKDIKVERVIIGDAHIAQTYSDKMNRLYSGRCFWVDKEHRLHTTSNFGGNEVCVYNDMKGFDNA